MPLSDHLYRTAKWKARIVTCDPTTGRIEAVLGDGAIRQIGASGTTASFRWPIEGEVWTVRQENNDWVLAERWPDDTEDYRIDELAVGDVRIDGNAVYDANGTRLSIATPFVTSLPTVNLFHGMEIIYQADATNGRNWYLKYNLNSASAFKWECIGGRPLVSEVATDQTTASVSYIALGTAGPSIALPLAGDYDVEFGAVCGVSGVGNGFMSYDTGGTAATDAEGQQNAVVSGVANSLMRARRRTGLTAVTLTAKYRAVSGTCSFGNRWMRVMPVRVG